MKVTDARRIIEAAKKQAETMDKAVSIIVVNAAGIPILLEKNGEPAAFTSVVAEGKAAGSAFTGRDSVLNRTMAETNPVMVTAVTARLAGRFVPVQGAVVLRQAGLIVGAVGTSGATAEEDEQISKAGAAAVNGGESLK